MTEKHFRKIMGYRDLWTLKAALDQNQSSLKAQAVLVKSFGIKVPDSINYRVLQKLKGSDIDRSNNEVWTQNSRIEEVLPRSFNFFAHAIHTSDSLSLARPE